MGERRNDRTRRLGGCGAILLVAAGVWSAAANAAEWSRLSPGADRWEKATAAARPAGGVALGDDFSLDSEPSPQAGGNADGEPAAIVMVSAESEADPDDDETQAGACDEADQACDEALGKLRSDTLASIDLDIRVGGRPGNDYPCECRLEGETFEPRRFSPTTFTWKAAGYCHKPLYFEQWNLERYGHSYGFIPDVFLSGAHFFVTLPILPYKMGVELPWECVYPLGYYRPGSCAPWTCPAVPISGRGLALEAATITGAVFLLP